MATADIGKHNRSNTTTLQKISVMQLFLNEPVKIYSKSRGHCECRQYHNLAWWLYPPIEIRARQQNTTARTLLF